MSIELRPTARWEAADRRRLTSPIGRRNSKDMGSAEDPSAAADQGGKDGRANAAEGRGAGAVYTRTGDAGRTGLRGGQRVSKGDRRVDAYGTVDELNAQVGMTRELVREAVAQAPALAQLEPRLGKVQHMLFNLGSLLASLPADLTPTQRRITTADVEWLEQEMDRCSAELAPLSTFVLPGGSVLNAALHVARTVCRRAERRCVELAAEGPVDPASLTYLNRLSDTFFVWARWAAAKQGVTETTWDPTQ